MDFFVLMDECNTICNPLHNLSHLRHSHSRRKVSSEEGHLCLQRRCPVAVDISFQVEPAQFHINEVVRRLCELPKPKYWNNIRVRSNIT